MLINELVLPIRFVTSVFQLVMTVAVWLDRRLFVEAALPKHFTKSQYLFQDAEFQGALRVGETLMVLELFSLIFVGSTILLWKLNLSHSFFHGVGCVLVFAFYYGSLHFVYYWYIMALTVAVPFAFEALALWGIWYTKMLGPYWG